MKKSNKMYSFCKRFLSFYILLDIIIYRHFLQDWGNEKLQRAQKTVDESSYDLEAWSILIRESQNRPITEVRPVFEKLVSVFPSAGRYWKIYIEQEVTLANCAKYIIIKVVLIL